MLLVSVLPRHQWDNPCLESPEQGSKGSSVPWQHQMWVHVETGAHACAKGKFQLGSNKQELADSSSLKHGGYWQQWEVLTSGQVLHDQANKILGFLPSPWNGKDSSCCIVEVDL